MLQFELNLCSVEKIMLVFCMCLRDVTKYIIQNVQIIPTVQVGLKNSISS